MHNEQYVYSIDSTIVISNIFMLLVYYKLSYFSDVVENFDAINCSDLCLCQSKM